MRSLSDLKRTLAVGVEFEITGHARAEAVGENRRITYVNTQGFYSINPSAPDGKAAKANGGKGFYLGWGAAKFWRFKENNVVTLYSSAEEQTPDTLIIEFRVITGEEK